MMVLAILLQGAATAAAPPAMPPADWSTLAPLPHFGGQLPPAMAQFAADEVAAGHCKPARGADGRWTIRLDVATLIASDGTVRRAVPRAINCPSVEQYAAGLVSRIARDNAATRTGSDQWYRATIVFDGK